MSKSSESRPSMLRAIGLMSGTSMDGIDVAMIETDGETRVERKAFGSFAYDDAFRGQLRQGLEDAVAISSREERPGNLAALEGELTMQHVEAVRAFLARESIDVASVDLVAFHGQTVLHRPDRRLTVQIGDAALLASALGVDVVHDLRADDVAAGGQGAPLAPVYHRAMVAGLERDLASAGPMAVLNIGGVANVTFVASHGDLLAFDTGPGNALIDDWVFSRTGDAFDADGQVSAAGVVDEAVLSSLMNDDYFAAVPPKSLDRNHFMAKHLGSLSPEDGAATLAAFTVEAVAAAEKLVAERPLQWIVCGGGRRNATIMAGLRARLSGGVVEAEAVGFDGDAVEAEAWAYLGVRSLRGLALTYPGTTGVVAETTGGVVVRAG